MVTSARRFTHDQRCPICDGSERDHRGAGRRDFGYLSEDGNVAFCTRPEFAGNLPFNPASQTYKHRLDRECGCGVEHGEYRAPAAPLNRAARRAANRTRPTVGQRSIVATYDYCNADGALVYQVVRYSPKSFAQRRPNGPRGWEWDLLGVTPILYHLPQLRAADPARPVYVTEGEKDVLRLEALGQVATCNSGGALKWKPEFAVELRGRHVVILPDADEAGEAHAEQVAASLDGVAASVRTVRLPGLAHGGDVSDWLASGWPLADLERLVDEAPVRTNLSPPEPQPPAESPVPAILPEPAPEPSDGDELARLRAENAALRDQLARAQRQRDDERRKRAHTLRTTRKCQRERNELRRRFGYLSGVQGALVRSFANEAVSAQDRIAAAVVALKVAAGVRDGHDNDGFVRVYFTEPDDDDPRANRDPAKRGYSLARRAGCSKNTIKRSVAGWVDRGVFDMARLKDDDGWHERVSLAIPDGNAITTLERVAAWRPPAGMAKRNGHGGVRVVCPDHPTAPVVSRRSCSACDRELSVSLSTARGLDPTAEHDIDGDAVQDAPRLADESGASCTPQDDRRSLGVQDAPEDSTLPPMRWLFRGRDVTGWRVDDERWEATS